MEGAKNVGDAISVGIVITTVAGWLPAIAAVISIVYGVIRIYETKTVQRWINDDRWEEE